MILQPNIKTKCTADEFIQASSDAHVRIFGIVPSDVLLWVFSAWSSFETWHWLSMHDWNALNMRGTWHGMATTFKASEIIDGKEVFMPPSANNLFRAYPGLAEGVEDGMRFVGTASHPELRPNRYERAWNAALVGDIPTFVDGLAHPTLPGVAHVPGFFTANPRVYLAGVELHAESLRIYFPGLMRDTEPADGGEVA